MNINLEVQKLVDKILSTSPKGTLSLGVNVNGVLSWENYDFENQKYYDDKFPNYEIGSLTKLFTAFYIIHLINKSGDITLETQIDEIIPDLPLGNYPTIKELMMHQSGYGYFLPLSMRDIFKIIHYGTKKFNPYYENMLSSNVHIILKKKKPPRLRIPVYSNFGYAILGYIISIIEKNSFEDCMNTFNRKVLNLKYTSFDNERLLTGYYKGENCGNWNWSNVSKNNVGRAAGGLRSNIVDMLKFSNVIMEEFAKPKAQNFGIIGMRRKTSGLWFKVGQTGTHYSVMVFDSTKNISVVVLLNSVNKYCLPLAFELIEGFLN